MIGFISYRIYSPNIFRNWIFVYERKFNEYPYYPDIRPSSNIYIYIYIYIKSKIMENLENSDRTQGISFGIPGGHPDYQADHQVHHQIHHQVHHQVYHQVHRQVHQ